MKKVLTAILLAGIAVAAFGQKPSVPKPVFNKTSAAEVTAYKTKASQAAEVVIGSADKVKEFEASATYDEIWYSTESLKLYRDQLTSHAELMTTVHNDLLGTATDLLIMGQNKAAAAERGMKYKGVGY